MDIEYMLKTTEYGDTETCRCCGYEGPVHLVKGVRTELHPVSDDYFCQICAEAGFSSAFEYPRQQANARLMQLTAYALNIIRDDIRKLNLGTT